LRDDNVGMKVYVHIELGRLTDQSVVRSSAVSKLGTGLACLTNVAKGIEHSPLYCEANSEVVAGLMHTQAVSANPSMCISLQHSILPRSEFT
jgi:hypothetical protein